MEDIKLEYRLLRASLLEISNAISISSQALLCLSIEEESRNDRNSVFRTLELAGNYLREISNAIGVKINE